MKKTLVIDEKQILIGAKALKEGKLVVFPTETVYGLGADAMNPKAVKEIFKAKGRPSDNPLIVHIAEIKQLEKLVIDISGSARKLMDAFWPGPLTLVMNKSDLVPKEITAGLNTVAIRMPSNQIALDLIKQSGVPVAAPSANLSGKPSPTNEEHVIKDLMGRVDVIVKGGNTVVGLESTVLDITTYPARILRPGYITYEDIQSVIGIVEYDANINDKNAIPKSPGMKYSHYSPDADVIIACGQDKVEILNKLKKKYEAMGKSVGIMATEDILESYEGIKCSLGKNDDLEMIAKSLFGCLRELDLLGVEVILTHSIEKKGIGVAIMNRLEKAAGYKIISKKEEI